jgi:hypothetical protein
MIEIVKQAAAVAVLATLLSESTLATPIRDWLFKKTESVLWFCPICLGFWIALPTIYYGPVHYLSVVGVSHLFMLITLHVYAELDKLNT